MLFAKKMLASDQNSASIRVLFSVRWWSDV